MSTIGEAYEAFISKYSPAENRSNFQSDTKSLMEMYAKINVREEMNVTALTDLQTQICKLQSELALRDVRITTLNEELLDIYRLFVKAMQVINSTQRT